MRYGWDMNIAYELPILGVGAALPARCVSNNQLVADLAARGVETNSEWIESRTGIQQRYICDEAEGTLSLAREAVGKAIASSGVALDDITVLVVATCSPERTFPSVAAMVQGELALPTTCFALDVNAACGGFLAALSVARGHLLAAGKGTAVVVGVDVFSRLVDWQDRGTCVLFGDGAGALVMKVQPQTGVEPVGLLGVSMGSDGTMASALQATGGVSLTGTAGVVEMQGREVFKHAVRQMGSAPALLADVGLTLNDVDFVVPHQANLRILEAAAKSLDLPMEKVVVTVDKHANTSAASIPLALNEAWERFDKGDVLLLQAFGAGFVWGDAVIKL